MMMMSERGEKCTKKTIRKTLTFHADLALFHTDSSEIDFVSSAFCRLAYGILERTSWKQKQETRAKSTKNCEQEIFKIATKLITPRALFSLYSSKAAL